MAQTTLASSSKDHERLERVETVETVGSSFPPTMLSLLESVETVESSRPDPGVRHQMQKGPRKPGKFLELDSTIAAQLEYDRKRSLTIRFGQEGKKKACAKRLVLSQSFTLIIASAIVLNAVYDGLYTDLYSDETEYEMAWYLTEVIFTVLFLVELVLRVVAAMNLREFFSVYWNDFDFILVVLSVVDTFVLQLIIGNNSELSMINTVRTLRLARVARILRLLRFFGPLWALVAGIIEAVQTLMWTWVLLILLVYIFGVFTTRVIGQPHREDPEIDAYFGNVLRSMFTLFQVTTLEAWATVARKAMEKEPWTAAIFIIYLYVTLFAVMNVVTAVIVENTLDQAGELRDKFLARRQENVQEAAFGIYKVFRSADADGNGVLTREEFIQEIRRAEDNEELRKYLSQLGIDIRQAENLFSILDYDESNTLNAEEFVGGMMKAVGPALAKDVLAVKCDNMRSDRKVREKLAEVTQGADAQMAVIEQGVMELRRELREIAQACRPRVQTAD